MIHEFIPHSRPWITEEDQAAISQLLIGGMISQGKATSDFELMISKYLGVKHCVAQSSGTAALLLALKTLGIGKRDGVILPTYVCKNVLEAVLSVDAEPQLCDVNEYGVITSDTIRHVLKENTKVILAIHIFGNPVNINDLRIFGLPIIEDACQSFGLITQHGKAGTLGDIGILSFHATKLLTTGEGGMLITNNEKMFIIANQLAQGGLTVKKRVAAPMSDLQSALGISQLSRYDKFLKRRSELREIYESTAKELDLKIGIDKRSSLAYRFTLRVTNVKKYQQLLHKLGVAARMGVDQLLHRIIGNADDHFPSAVGIYNSNISIPFYPSLSEREIEKVLKSLKYIAKCH